jgi:helicase
LNDNERGPTLEVLITILRKVLKNLQIIGLSATIGNPSELAEWLEAELILDDWRPVQLKKGIYTDQKVEFYE